jgi:beta-lactam-binding protein with PASTA domain/tetratricopeptide (TPR) repeat protein
MIVALLAVAISVAAVASDPISLGDAVKRAEELLLAGDAKSALDVLNGVTPAETDSARARARVLFYTARAHEDLTENDAAVAAYKQAIEIDPAYGAALNNLAQLYVANKNYDDAIALYKRAMQIKDARSEVYAMNYAAALAAKGDKAAARAVYERIAAGQPWNTDVQSRLLALTDDGKEAAARLHSMIDRGAIDPAQQLAFDLLASRPFDARGKSALLDVVVTTLARQHISADAFDGLPAAQRLGALRSDPDLREAVREIKLLYAGGTAQSDFQWWSKYAPTTFGALAKDLGAQAAKSDPRMAERYDTLALQMSGGTDPDAFLALADLFYSQKRLDSLNALATQYRAPMFDAKSDAIRSGNLSAEYRFHVALGTMYTYLGQYGDESTPTSAIFQLKRAKDVAEASQQQDGPKITVDPKVIDLLATGYTKVSAPDVAARVRLESAETFKRQGRTAAATRVFKPLASDPSSLKEEYREQFARVQHDLLPNLEIVKFPQSVPSLVGLSWQEAEKRLTDAGLHSRTKMENSDAPKGTVIKQDPPAGTGVPQGSEIVAYVSAGSGGQPETVVVPSIVKLDAGTASKLIQGAGLRIRMNMADSDAPKGTVIKQDPPAGTRVLQGSEIVAYVSSGSGQPDTVIVPNIVKLDAGTASKLIHGAGLRIQMNMANSDAPKGMVIKQDPPAGTRVPQGSEIVAYVSSGSGGQPETVVVPSIVKLDAGTASKLIQGAGLRIQMNMADSDAPKGMVIKQDPPAGTRLPPGSEIVAYVSSGGGQSGEGGSVIVPNVIKLDAGTASKLIQGAGLVFELKRGKSDRVIRQEPPGGSKVPRGTRVIVYTD